MESFYTQYKDVILALLVGGFGLITVIINKKQTKQLTVIHDIVNSNLSKALIKIEALELVVAALAKKNGVKS